MDFIRWLILDKMGDFFCNENVVLAFFMNLLIIVALSVPVCAIAGHFPIFWGILLIVNLIFWLIPAYVLLETIFKEMRKEYHDETGK